MINKKRDNQLMQQLSRQLPVVKHRQRRSCGKTDKGTSGSDYYFRIRKQSINKEAIYIVWTALQD